MKKAHGFGCSAVPSLSPSIDLLLFLSATPTLQVVERDVTTGVDDKRPRNQDHAKQQLEKKILNESVRILSLFLSLIPTTVRMRSALLLLTLIEYETSAPTDASALQLDTNIRGAW